MLLFACDTPTLPVTIDARRLAVESGLIDRDDPTAQVADMVIAELDGVPPEEVVLRTVRATGRTEALSSGEGVAREIEEQLQAFSAQDGGWLPLGEPIIHTAWDDATPLEGRSIRATDIDLDGRHELLQVHPTEPAWLTEKLADAKGAPPRAVWLWSWTDRGVWWERLAAPPHGSVGVFDTDADGQSELVVLSGATLLVFADTPEGILRPRDHDPKDWLADFLDTLIDRPASLPGTAHLSDWIGYAMAAGIPPTNTATLQARLQERYLAQQTAAERVPVVLAMEWLARPTAAGWMQARLSQPNAPVEALMNAIGAADPDALEAILVETLSGDREHLTLTTAGLLRQGHAERNKRIAALALSPDRTEPARMAMLVGLSAAPELAPAVFVPGGPVGCTELSEQLDRISRRGWFDRRKEWMEHLSTPFVISLLDEPDCASMAATDLHHRSEPEAQEAVDAALQRSLRAIRSGHGLVNHPLIALRGDRDQLLLGISAVGADDFSWYFDVVFRDDISPETCQQLAASGARFLAPEHTQQVQDFAQALIKRCPSPEISPPG